MAFFLQLRLLLWKNFTLRKRQPIRTVIEIIWPLILFLILVWVKLDNADLQQRIHECHFEGKAMPSAGFLPFFQTLFCTANNTCHKTPRYGETSTANNFVNSSILSQLLNEVEVRVDDLAESRLVEKFMGDMQTLREVLDIVSKCDLPIQSLMKDPSDLRNRLLQNNIRLSSKSIDTFLKSSVNTTALLALRSNERLLREFSMESLERELCQEKLLKEILVAPPDVDGEVLMNELCSLTSAQFGTFFSDLYQSVDLDLLVTWGRKCITNEVDFFQSIRIFFNIAQMYLHVSEAEEMFKKFNKTAILANELVQSVDLPTFYVNDFEANSTLSWLRLASRVVCQSDDLLNATFQEDNDYMRKYAEIQKQGGGGGRDIPFKNQSDAGFRYDNSTSQFCNDFFSQIQQNSHPGVRLLWLQVKPMIRGKIPFTPDTPLVRRIVKQANWTFEYMASIHQLSKDLLENWPQIEEFITSNQTRNFLQTALSVASAINFDNKELNEVLRRLQLQLNDSALNDSGNWQQILNITKTAVTFVATYSECFQFDKFEPFRNETELVKTSLRYIENQMLWAGLVFDVNESSSLSQLSANKMPSFISFKIRMDSDRVDTTRKFKVTDRYWSPGPRAKPVPDMKYIVFGFAYLQDLVEHAIIYEQTGIDDVGISVQQFPYPCYIDDKFTLAISRSLPLFMTLAWIFMVAMIVKGIVYEKEFRLKEVMKIMGLGNGVHWVSWFITSFIMMMISVLLLVIVLKAGRVLEHSNGFVVFIFLFVFSVATIFQCFMFSVFFSRANLAAACAAIFFFIGYLPYALCVQWEEFMELWQKCLACLSSTVAFGFGCSYIARYEQQGVGIQWHNMAQSPILEDTYSMTGCMIMMTIDALVYALIAWYVEAVFPGQYGVPKPWYFCFTKSYWCGAKYKSDNTLPVDVDVELHANGEESAFFETEPEHLPLGVAIKNLRKIYGSGQRLAVDNLTLNFYEGQITSFLGHNGAGKTTTMSILTGLFPPSHGTAYVYGKDIRCEMDEIRKDMGMCPQHNVLFDSLTVEEHLYFYSSLKGIKKTERDKEIKKMIADVGLPHKRNALASDLSGGMKRKLSIAVAFTAGSRVVILDEPTAGVDPYARRSIWDLLLKYKHGRTIILSTHFMDEADILGDRIAIISQGKLCCCGSSLFLKNLFGSGYYLTVTRLDSKRSPEPVTVDGVHLEAIEGVHNHVDTTSAVDRAATVNGSAGDQKVDHALVSESPDVVWQQQELLQLIRRHVPDAILVETLVSEFTFQLPDDKESVAKFDKLFADIDRNSTLLGISGYGISNTTLEEVFLKVAKFTGVDEDNEESEQHREVANGIPLVVETRPVSCTEKLCRCLSRQSQRPERSIALNGYVLDDEVDSEYPEHASLLPTPLFSQDAVEDIVESRTDHDLSNDNQSCNGTGEAGFQCHGAGTYRVSGTALLFRQFWALFVKRFHYVRRSKKAFFTQIVLPAIFICLAMVFSKINPPVPELPAMELHPWLMTPGKLVDDHLYLFYSNDLADANWTQEMEDMLFVKPGLGTRCMDKNTHALSGFPCSKNGVKFPSYSGYSPLYSNVTERCDCDTGYQQCSAVAVGPEPPKFLLPSTDYLYNMTHQPIPEWIVRTNQDYRLKRYGGLSFGEKGELLGLNETQLMNIASQLRSIVSEFGDLSVLLRNMSISNRTINDIVENVNNIFSRRMVVSKNAKVWFNNKGYVAMVAYMNVMSNLILRANLEPGSDMAKYGISVTSHPMNRTKAQLAEYAIRASGVDALIAISVIFALSQIPASFILFLIEERESGSKHLQFVSGINPTVYWVTNFIWDMCNYMVSASICILLFLAFQQREYVSAANAPCLVALLFLYGWAITPMMYPMAYVFSVPSTAFVVMGCINIFIGILSTLSTFILELFMEERLDRINEILRKVFLVLPHFCLGRGLIDMTRNQLVADVFAAFGENLFRNPFSWDLVGRNLFCLFVIGVFFFILTLCFEYRFWVHRSPCYRNRLSGKQLSSLESSVVEDVDVAAERTRVTSGAAEADHLTIHGLTKVYKKMFSKDLHLAVDNITVGVKKGECFGLLGVNGAGKTTTFKMLTGDLSVTSGDAHLVGHSILTDIVSVHQNLGYCPQFDALISLLTPTEHLEMFARLRGVPEKDVKTVAKWAIRQLGLVRHKNKLAGDLSGGNKRKLSTAIALVGNPSVIFLDEPTTGMDPKARRFLWDAINRIKRDGHSVVLTSHSMEECEALCDRIAIMVNGSFKCLGSIQHLKNRFGSGYTVVLRVCDKEPKLSDLKQFVSTEFPDSQLKEQHHCVVRYQFPSNAMPLSLLFGTIESIRDRFNIEDYSVTQTTLDQVFINFAKFQAELQIDEQDAAVVNGIADNQTT